MYSGMIAQAAAAFPELDISDSEWFYENVISDCDDIYRGDPPWKTVKKSGLYQSGEREMAILNAAKVLCDELADMTFGQQADIAIADDDTQRFAERVLQDNSFWDRMPQFFSRAYALGGGAVRVFIADGKVMLDYIDADSFIPTGMDGRKIDEAVFRNRTLKNGRYYTLFEKHGHSPDGMVTVENRLFVSDSIYELGQRCSLDELYGGLDDIIGYGSETPMFSYFHPAAANNLFPSGRLGLSCFANCTDTLKAIDVAFDSLMREFILGRKRIIVPSSCIRTVVDPETGSVRRYFDSDDEVFQALRCDEEKDLKIIDNTAELRIDEHVSALNALMNLLCFQTGLSSGTLSFGTSSGVRTAAEISSQENRTIRTMNSNRNIAVEFIEGIVKAIVCAGIYSGSLPESAESSDIRVSFPKELDRDPDRIIDRNIRLCGAGLRSRESAVMEINDCSRDDAVNELKGAKS